MKRFVSILLVLVLSCTLFTACGGSGGTSSGETGASSSSGSTASSSGGAMDFKFATVGNETHQSTIGAEFFKEKLEELSGGTMTVSIFPNGALGGEREAAEGVKLATIDMTIVTTDGALPSWVPDTQVLSIPYLFTTKAEAYNVLDTLLQDELAPQFEAQGFKHIGFMELGFRHFTNNVREVRTAEDMKGLSIRVQEAPVWFALTDALGASGVPVSFNELYTALQQGMVDGQENPITSIASSRFDEVQKYMVMDGHTYAAQSFIMNLDLYNSLSAEQQAWVEEAGRYAIDNQRIKIDAMEEEYLADLVAGGMEVVTDPDLSGFIAATENFHLRDDVKDLVTADLVEKVLAQLGR